MTWYCSLQNWYKTKGQESSLLIFIVQFISNNLEHCVCKALKKCATFCSVKSLLKKKKKNFHNFYNNDMVFLLYSIFTKKKYIQVHMPLYLTIHDRSEAKPKEKNYKNNMLKPKYNGNHQLIQSRVEI